MVTKRVFFRAFDQEHNKDFPDITESRILEEIQKICHTGFITKIEHYEGTELKETEEFIKQLELKVPHVKQRIA